MSASPQNCCREQTLRPFLKRTYALLVFSSITLIAWTWISVLEFLIIGVTLWASLLNNAFFLKDSSQGFVKATAIVAFCCLKVVLLQLCLKSVMLPPPGFTDSILQIKCLTCFPRTTDSLCFIWADRQVFLPGHGNVILFYSSCMYIIWYLIPATSPASFVVVLGFSLTFRNKDIVLISWMIWCQCGPKNSYLCIQLFAHGAWKLLAPKEEPDL